MLNPKISVVIPAYNVETCVSRAIESVQKQTFQDFEIIVIDDASTDHTRSVVENLVIQDPRIQLLKLAQNSGPSVARNKGIDEARGDWISVLDADDAYLSDRLERLMSVAHDSDADIVADNFYWYDITTKKIKRVGLIPSDECETADLRQYVAKGTPYGQETDWGLLKPIFRSAYIKAKGARYPIQTRHGEDFLFMFNLLAFGAKFVLSRKPGYLYTTRASGLSRTIADFSDIVRQTFVLLELDFVKQDPILTMLLRKRINDVRRFTLELAFIRQLKNRELNQALLSFVKHPLFITQVILTRIMKIFSPKAELTPDTERAQTEAAAYALH